MAEKKKRKSRHARPTGVAGVTGNPKGAGNGNAKLDETKVRHVKALLEGGTKQMHIAELFGVSPSVIGLIKRGKIWREVI
ncbi:MAG: hypothetical protein IT381_21205 [Deltaproteobacteria bacterium]|nr:hypothetical protein [Deltaproteobacteria bacterium]